PPPPPIFPYTTLFRSAPPPRGPCIRVFKATRAVSDKPKISVERLIASSGPASIIKIDVANSTITGSKSSSACEINAICTFHLRRSEEHTSELQSPYDI